MTELLSRQVVAIDSPTPYQATATHLACWHSQEQVLEFLVSKGANVNAKSVV